MTRREWMALAAAAPLVAPNLTAADSPSIDQFFNSFFEKWVMANPEQASSMRLFTGDVQDRLDGQLSDISDAAAHARIARAKDDIRNDLLEARIVLDLAARPVLHELRHEKRAEIPLGFGVESLKSPQPVQLGPRHDQHALARRMAHVFTSDKPESEPCCSYCLESSATA